MRRTRAGNQVLVGYVVPDGELDTDAAALALREQLPAALVPLLAVVDDAADAHVGQGRPGRAAVAAARAASSSTPSRRAC